MFGTFKLKLYGLIAALGAGLMAVIYAMGNSTGKAKERDKVLKGRIEGMKHKQEVENEVDTRNDDDLVAGIVRKRR